MEAAAEGINPAGTPATQDPIIINLTEKPGKVKYADPSIKKRSFIYTLFTWNDTANKFNCNNCKKEYAAVSSILTNHIKRKHPVSLEKKLSTDAFVNQPSVGKLFAPGEKRMPITKEETESRLINFIVLSVQPFTLVEEDGFKQLIDYVSHGHPNVQLPSARTIRRKITKLFCDTKTALREEMNNNDSKISFAVDCWTSSNQKPFQGVVGMWINSEWELVTRVIDLTVLEGSHTGDNIAAAFSDVLIEFGIWSKLLCIVTDNASNMDTFFGKLDEIAAGNDSLFNSKDNRVRCLAHIMNLACQDIIKSIEQYGLERLPESNSDSESEDESIDTKQNPESFLVKLRTSIRKIRSSPQRREIFKTQCVKLKIQPKTLILDVRTRWNYTLKMLERSKELRRALELTMHHITKLKKYALTSEEWEKVNSLISMLGPFREATEMLSITHSPTISHTSAVYQLLFDHLEKFCQSNTGRQTSSSTKLAEVDHKWLTSSAEKGFQKLKKYYPETDGLAYWASTNPRYKLTWYKQVGWRKEWIDAARKGVTEAWNHNYKPMLSSSTSDEAINPQNKNDSGLSFQSILSKQMKGADKLAKEDELKRYLTEPVVSSERLYNGKSGVGGVLGWWKNHQSEYPFLSRMARDYLAVPGTGVPVERFFSSGAELLSPYRQSLSSQSIKEMMCLKNWLLHNRDAKLYNRNLRSALVHKMLGNPEEECE